MLAKSLVLQEHLHHPVYEWPYTLLRFPVRFEPGEVREEELGKLKVCEKAGGGQREILFQLSDIVTEDGWAVSAVCCIGTDLPSGARKEFILQSAESNGNEREDDLQEGGGREAASLPRLRVSPQHGGYCAESAELRLGVWGDAAFPREGQEEPPGVPLFQIGLADGGGSEGWGYLTSEAEGEAPVPESRTVVCRSRGPLFAEFKINCALTEEGEYSLLLRVFADLPFVELEECISGMPDGAAAMHLDLIWRNGGFGTRYTPNRGEEPVDAYLGSGGELPFMILPYRNWNSWWHEKSAAFCSGSPWGSGSGGPDSGRFAAGVFVRDAAGWDDGAYALWGSLPKLGITFRCEGESLVWRYPLADGTRSTAVALLKGPAAADDVEHLRLWYSLLHLDKVKDWILDWEEPRPAAPRHFRPDPAFAAGPGEMERMAAAECRNFNEIRRINPVSAREFFRWAPLFDLSAPAMTDAQYKRLRAASAFMAYVHMDENVMPVRRMLAGHPNFLADVASVPGLMAALFPGHPHGAVWREYFERAMALNLKYHTRPDVEAWEAQGGRWTENLGVYVWAALKPMVRTAVLLAAGGDCPILYPNLAKVAEWLLHALSAPVGGKRTYPPQGAHADYASSRGIPHTLRDLGALLQNYLPGLAEQIRHGAALDALAPEKGGEDAVWRRLLDERSGASVEGSQQDQGVAPQWRSVKLTGYGYVLRSGAGTPKEVSLHLQQLDRGPNYRWGRASDGGNGVLYYYAAGQRYSWNGPEDVGDVNRGDAEACTNFAVVRDRVFRGIGSCELTEPMHDFGFAQYACIVSDSSERQDYRARSVLLSGTDYAVIYDEVADMRVKGRFSWFVHAGEPFPALWQLKPGAAGIEAAVGRPVDWSGSYDAPDAPVRGRYYDGHGDFLTLVSHLPEEELTAKAVEFGAIVSVGKRTDYVFRHQAVVRWEESGLGFTGRAGVIRLDEEGGLADAAIFDGTRMRTADFEVELKPQSPEGLLPKAGFSCKREKNRLTGAWHTEAPCTAVLKLPRFQAEGRDFFLYMDGVPKENALPGEDGSLVLRLEAGFHSWEWTDRLPCPGAPAIRRAIVSADGVLLEWSGAPSADMYRIAVRETGDGARREYTCKADLLSLRLPEVVPGRKYIVQVQAFNRDHTGPWSCEYPVYGSAEPPAPPAGLRVKRSGGGLRVSWGQVSGAGKYRLYRMRLDGRAEDSAAAGSGQLVYEGDMHEYEDREACGSDGAVYGYCVSAVNGNGEGARSPMRDGKPGGLADWDPCPEESFRRDPRSHEYGFSGYDPWQQDGLSPLPPYPADRPKRTE